MTAPEFSLQGAFDAATEADWQAIAEKSLKGKPLDKLHRQMPDGFSLAPLYAAGDAVEERHLGRDATPWAIGQFYEASNLRDLNRQILEDLEGGVNAISLRLLGERAVPIETVDDLDRALEGVNVEYVPLYLDGAASSMPAAVMKIALYRNRGLDLSSIPGSLDLDPFHILMRGGLLPASMPVAMTTLSRVVTWVQEHGAGLRTNTLDATAIAEGGGSDSLELACLLSAGLFLLRSMQERDIDPAWMARRIGFRLSVGTHLFDNIAKIRAFRMAWQRLLEASDIAPFAAHVEARGRSAQMSNLDPWVNMLRGGSQVMAAALGGADQITIDCFDSRFGQSDDLARKIMRNQQLMLQEECGLWRVSDPAAGSWFAEQHTDKLAEAAWQRFTEMEAAGGIAEALLDGSLAAECARSASKRQQAIATRKIPLTGISEFPDIHEERLNRQTSIGKRLDPTAVGVVSGADDLVEALIAAAQSGASLSELAASRPAKAIRVTPIKPVLQGQDFEALRDQADTGGLRPVIFLANLGPVAAHTARATFARNFFAAGGIAALDEGGFDKAADAAAAFAKSGARIAVICGADSAYDDMDVPVCSALKDAGAAAIWLAGRAGENDKALSAAGLQGYIGMGVNLVETLHQVHQILGLEGALS